VGIRDFIDNYVTEVNGKRVCLLSWEKKVVVIKKKNGGFGRNMRNGFGW
jgi:hypothetical protein